MESSRSGNKEKEGRLQKVHSSSEQHQQEGVVKKMQSTSESQPQLKSGSMNQVRSEQNKDHEQKQLEQEECNRVTFKFQENVVFCVENWYKVNNLVGYGGYGLVASGENIKTGEKVAIKKVQQLFRYPESAKRELREIKILKFFKHKHKNIVNLLDIMEIPNPLTYSQIYLVMELMPYDLTRLIHSKKPISENMRKYILYQILDGVQYMHSADIIHRDLKPQNILLNTKCEVKIIDMNLARKEEIFSGDVTLYVTTRHYRAFQVLLSANNYTKSIDIWSVGCIFAELIGRTVLFEGRDPCDQLKRLVAIMGKPEIELYQDIDIVSKTSFTEMIRSMPDRQKIEWKTLFPHADPLALDLLDHMLVYNPAKRYTAEQCLNHPYLKQIRQKSTIIKCQAAFDFSFDNIPAEESVLREAILQEVSSYCSNKGSSPKNPKERPKVEEKDMEDSVRKRRKAE